jgi:chlorobactene glucosyltransferase
MTWLPLPPWIPWALLAGLLVEWWLTQSRLRDLAELPEPEAAPEPPSICLCIPARNEALEIGRALDSWLAQDYPSLRILVVDDGSTDGTEGLLAQRVARQSGRLRVLRNESLPAGWLGKNHALHLATQEPEAQAADWLLFVDADVRAEPTLLGRVMAHLAEQPADLLTLIAAVETVGVAERIFIPPALVHFLLLVPPRRVADPRSRFSCGTGAFTIVRKEAYDAIGGHAAAPLEPIDDMRLAQRAKTAGFRLRMAQGGPALRLRMYHDLPEILRALRKNTLGLPHLWLLAPVLVPLLAVLSLSPPSWGRSISASPASPWTGSGSSGPLPASSWPAAWPGPSWTGSGASTTGADGT